MLDAALQYLDLSHNHFTGPPPLAGPLVDGAGGHHHERLTHVLLNHNGFTGPLPALQPHKPALHSLDLSRNALNGHIPRLDLPTLEFVDLSHNALTGGLPALDAKLAFLSVAYNKLSGRLALPKQQQQQQQQQQREGVGSDGGGGEGEGGGAGAGVGRGAGAGAARVVGSSWAELTQLIGFHAEHNAFDGVEPSFCDLPQKLFQSFEKGRGGGGCHLAFNPIVRGAPPTDAAKAAAAAAAAASGERLDSIVAPVARMGLAVDCDKLPQCVLACSLRPGCG